MSLLEQYEIELLVETLMDLKIIIFKERSMFSMTLNMDQKYLIIR